MILDTISNFPPSPPPLPPPLPNPFTASQPSQLYQVNPLFQPSQPNPPSQSSSQPTQPNPPSQPLATPEPHPSQPLATPEPHPSQPNPPSQPLAPPEPHPSQPLAPPEPYPSQPIPPSQPLAPPEPYPSQPNPPSQPSQLHQLSQPLAVPDDTIRKYPKLTVLSKVSTLAVKLARESYFGAEVLKGSTVAGCREYLPLSQNKLMEMKSFLLRQFPEYWANPIEFETKWATCLDSINQCCKSLRSGKTRK